MTIGKLILGVAAAYALAANAGTYALSNGETLIYSVDQGAPETTTFATADFVSIGAATTNEVCAVLNRDFAARGTPATATSVGGAVQITSNDDGQVLVTGGTAAATFAFASVQTQSNEAGAMPSAPTFSDVISFAGDGAYPTGGTLGFGAAVSAATKSTRKILAVIAQDCGGYLVSYNQATDALKVWKGNGTNAGQEVANAANLSAVTFNVLVISK